MSLWYSLINLAFGIPMNRFLGRGGFVVFWMLNWCTMGAGEWTRYLDYLFVFAVDRHSELTSIQWAYPWKAYTQSSGSNTRVISSLFVRPLNTSDSHHSRFPDFIHSHKGIIVNVSAAFTSFELMPRFYLYGYGLPFYNSVSASSWVGRKKKY